MAFLGREDFPAFRFIRKDVKIDEGARFVNPQFISIGSGSRIDGNTLLSAGEAGIDIGRRVHIAWGVAIFGQSGRVSLADCVGLSPYCCLFTETDILTAAALAGPTQPAEYRKTKKSDMVLCSAAVVGAHSILLPGAYMCEASVVGANTVLNCHLEEGEIHVKKREPKLGLFRDPKAVCELVSAVVEEYPQPDTGPGVVRYA